MISTLEKEITLRFLKARKKDGFLNVISIFSFIGISLGVAVLIIVMSVMNGFRSELINKIVGFNSHITVKTYERSIDQNAINVIEFEIVSPKGVARYSLSYKEIEHDNVSVYLHGSELSGERIKYYFEYFDATRNALYIELDDNEQNWDESHLCVTRMTTSCLSGERYRTGWLWGKNPDLTDKEMRSAESETKNLLVEIEEVNTEWRNYVDRPESF